MKKPDRKWIAVLAVLAGMAWAAGSLGSYQKNHPVEKTWTEKT